VVSFYIEFFIVYRFCSIFVLVKNQGLFVGKIIWRTIYRAVGIFTLKHVHVNFFVIGRTLLWNSRIRFCAIKNVRMCFFLCRLRLREDNTGKPIRKNQTISVAFSNTDEAGNFLGCRGCFAQKMFAENFLPTNYL